MSINTELNLLKDTKENLRTAIMEKGVVVSSSDLFSTYPTRISQISAQSGTYDESLKKLLDGSYTSYEIPNGTEKLKRDAFHSYTSLTAITIPPTIKTINSYAFYGCTSLNRVNITDLSAWCGIDFVTAESGNDRSNPLSIAHRLYMNGTQITNLVIPSDVTEIKPYVFFSASGFTSVVIPDSVTTIGSDAFRSCSGLNTVEIGTGITSIDTRAFYYCSGLTSITVKAETPPTIGSVVFNDTNNCPIYVPEESIQAYKTAWTDYASRIQAMPEVKFFRRITNINDVTEGKYLIVDTQNNVALNASLIASTTSILNGINANNNHISVNITGDTIEATETTLNAAADLIGILFSYNNYRYYLTWKGENTATYYLERDTNQSNSVFFKPNATSRGGDVIAYGNTGNLTFKANSYSNAIALYTNASVSKFRWQSTSTSSNFINVALFKLDE